MVHEVYGGHPECPLLWGGDVGDEGVDAHVEGDVAPGQSHGQVDGEQEELLGPGHEVGVKHHAT